jgi:para-nitrobenzyl esterase
MEQLAAALTLALGVVAGVASAAIGGTVRLDGGEVAGAKTADASVTAFRGLPYAAPPVGELRWRAPAPPKPWQGVRTADQPGPICPQPATPGNAGRAMDEDCLYLDIWTAASASAEHRPVMVWFHGGDAGFGAGSGPQYDGTALAAKGAVVVTVNYRGGPLGLLAAPELSQESAHHASGDYSLMDDVAALEWVQRNIAAFGGDPRNVTIFGQSWGSGTEHFLSLSPLAKGLFQRMINQSHARYPHDPELFAIGAGYRPLQAAEADGAKFERLLGVHSLKELRAVPWQKLIEAYGNARDLHWTYVLDGYVVPHSYADTYAAGAQADVFELAGDNVDESGASPDSAFDLLAAGQSQRLNFPALHRLSDYLKLARQKYGPMADEFLKLYPASNDREAFLSSSAAVRDNNRISTWMWATAWTQRHHKPVYLYLWTHAPPTRDHDLLGAYHGSEIAYVFDHLNPQAAAWTEEDRRIADRMSSYWVNFARSGDPNGSGLPQWPAFDGRTEQVMELGDHFQPIPLAEQARLDFWRRFYRTQPAG